MEQAKKISNMQSPLENSMMFYHIMVDMEGNYLYMNNYWRKRFHFLDLELGQPIHTSLHPDDLGLCHQTVEKCFADPGTPVSIELRKPGENGTYTWTNWEFSVILDEEGAPGGVNCVGTDVSGSKATEAEIRRVSQLYTDLTSQVPGVLYQYLRLPDGSFSFPYISDGIEDLYGVTVDQVMENSLVLFENVYPSDLEGIIKSIEEVYREKKTWNYEYRIYHPTKGLRWIRGNSKPEELEDGKVLFHGYLMDITDQKKAKQRLVESEQRNRIILDTLPDPIFRFSSTYEILDTQAYSEDRFGSSSLFLGKQLHEVLPKRTAQLIASKIDEALSTEKIVECHDQLTMPTGKVYFEMRLVKIQDGEVLAIVRDVTSIKEEEHRLKLLESVITHSRDAIMITEAEPITLPGPQIIFTNNAFREMTGYTSEEILGKTPRILQGPKTSEKNRKIIRDHLEAWKPCRIELLNYSKTGEEFWVDLSIVPVADETGWYTHWISIHRDISERKKGELQREKMIHELIKSNQELHQLSYIISHNLRAPVTNLMGLVNLFEEELQENTEAKELLHGIDVSTSQLNETVQDLYQVLAIKRNTWLERQDICLIKIINSVIKSKQSQLEGFRTKVIINFSNDLQIYFYPAYLENIFDQLFSNAIQYQAENRPLEIEINGRVLDCGDVLIEFKDNGTGLDISRYQNRIFGLYQRFHPNTKGKGFGLYLIKTQIEVFGGQIDVEGEVGKGLTFTLMFKSKTYATEGIEY